jgi:hypothetical protein
MKISHKILAEKYDVILDAAKKAPRKKSVRMTEEEIKNLCLKVFECTTFEQAKETIRKCYEEENKHIWFSNNVNTVIKPVTEICKEKGIYIDPAVTSQTPEFFKTIPYYLGSSIWFIATVYAETNKYLIKSYSAQHYETALLSKAKEYWDSFEVKYKEWLTNKKISDKIQDASKKANVNLDI